MRVILAEKPSVAKEIAHVVGATTLHKSDGYIEGGGYAVTWAFGHLVQIADPVEMDSRWDKPWTRESLPLTPARWLYNITDNGRAQYENIRKLFMRPDTTDIICATDAGREGELIFRLIYDKIGCSLPVKRLWISALTKEAITAGFSSLHPSAQFDALAAAAHSRQQWDWMYGLSLTRACTLQNSALFPCGRVQTPTLALVVRRDKDISGFVPSNFYEVHAAFAPGSLSFTAKFIDDSGSPEIETRQVAEAIQLEVDPIASGTVRKVTQAEKRISAPHLFDLVTLQKEANKSHGFTAQETLAITQELYEAKLATYPRTESRHLPSSMVPELAGILQSLTAHPDYGSHATQAHSRFAASQRLTKQYVDDGKLTDHHAIIPTHVPAAALPERQQKIYDLIARRFISIFFPEQIKAETEILIALGKRTFRAFGSITTQPGWTVVARQIEEADDNAGNDDSQALPRVTEGQVLRHLSTEIKTRQRQPPKPYTDATLLTAMKSAGRLIDDSDLAAYMKQNGLGTAATRAETIEKLLKFNYLTRDKKTLRSTPKGQAFIEQLPSQLSDPLLTAEWEQHLKQIEDGEADAAILDAQLRAHITQAIDLIFSGRQIAASALQGDTAAALPLGPCPQCKEGHIRLRKGSKGAFYGCDRYKKDGTGCGFSLPGLYGGKKITPTTAKQLCSDKQKTSLIKGFKSAKTGKSYDGFLHLKNDDGRYRIEIIFAPSQKK